MLNVMEERDIQIRGYVLRLPLDVLVVASANPEDYTNRGRIITPLKDRFGAEIRTHYPTELERRDRGHPAGGRPGRRGARPPGRDPGPVHPRTCASPTRSTSAPASRARFAIAGAETIAASALHRATAQGEDEPVARRRRPRDRRRRPRRQDRVRERRGGSREPRSSTHLLRTATAETVRAHLRGIDFALLVEAIEDGAMVTTGDQVTARDFLAGLPVLGESELYDEVCDRLGATNDGERAGAIELALEGLYLARKIGKDTDGTGDRLWLTPSPTVRPGRSPTSRPCARLGEAVVPATYGPHRRGVRPRMLGPVVGPSSRRAGRNSPRRGCRTSGRRGRPRTPRRSRATSARPRRPRVMWKLYVHPDQQGRGLGTPPARRGRATGRRRRPLWLELRRRQRPGGRLLPRARLRGGRAGRRRRRTPTTSGCARTSDERPMKAPLPASRRYDGGDPLAPPVDLAEALDAIGQDVMAGYSPERAMREFLRRGGRDQAGLDDLARRVAERRREMLQRHDLDGTHAGGRASCSTTRVLEERKQLARDVTMDDGDRAFREMQLDNLPPSTAAAVQRAVVVRLAEPRGPRGLREDQGPARPRAARPALRRHEAGARGRHRRGPRRRSTRCSATSTSCWRSTGRGEDTARGLRRLHGQARRLLPREPAEHRRAARLPRPAGGRRPADAQLDDARAARGADGALRSRRSARRS